MESSVMFIAIVVLMGLASSMAYPPFYYSPQMYEPELDLMDYYYPFVDSMTQSRSFSDYHQPYSQWPALINALNQQSNENTQDQLLGRNNFNDEDLGRRKEPIEGAYLIPTKTNGAFLGPLAVVPGKQEVGEFASNNVGSPSTQYLPIIDGPNWPFIKPATSGRSPLGLNDFYQNRNDQHFLFSPNYPYIYMYPYY